MILVKRLILILIILFGMGCASGQILIGVKTTPVITPPPVEAPNVPTLVSPADSADSVSTNAPLAWTSVDSADNYTVNVATDTGFSSIVVNSTLTGTSALASGLDSGTAYYWRVKATNSAGSSAWASYWTFTTITGSPPVAPLLVSPSNGADSVSLWPLLTWTPSATATSHKVQMSLSSGFLSLLLDTTVTGTSVQSDTLTNSTLYYWRVRSTNTWGTGPYSTGSFTTTPEIDSVAPAAVTTLASYLHDTVSVSLKWTAVGDDSLTGTATSYDLRYSTREFSTGNLVDNGTFETDTSGWFVWDGPATITRNTSIKRTGTGSLKVVNGGSDYAGVYDSIATTSSDSVYLSFYVYSTAIDTIDGWVLNDTGAVIGSFQTTPLVAATWTLVTVNRKLPGTQTAILVGFNWKPGASGDSLFLDDVTCTIGKDFDFFTQATGEPTPRAVTLFDSCTVSGLAAQTTYYFVLKVLDEEGNTSLVSNVVTQQTDTLATTPPEDETFDYIVATNGSDSNPGTLAEPFLTIGHAQSIAVPGDTIRIRAGTYHECVQFTESGTASEYIVYSNYNGESVTIDGDLSTGRVATLGLGQSISNRDVETDSIKYVRIENLTVTYRYEQDMATGSFFHPVLLGGENTHHIVLDSLTFTSSTDSAEGYSKNWKHYAICILKTHDVTVNGCTVTGVKGGGFKFALYFGNMIPPSYQRWENNTMTAWGSVINVGELFDYADSTVLHKSRITGNNLYGAWEEDGIQFESGYVKPSWAESLAVHSGWYIHDNDIWDCAENLIDLKGQREDVWVDANRMWWSRGDNNGVIDGVGTEGGAGLISKSRNSKYKTTWRFNEMWNSLGGMTPYVPAHVYHNTVVNNTMSYAGPRTFSSGNGIQWGQGSLGDILRYPSVTRGLGINNICAENPTSTFQGGGTWVWANSDTLELDYNLYYDSSGTAKNKTLYTGLNEADTKAEWLAALKANPPSRIIGGDSNSIWADPQFTTAPFNAQYAEYTFEVDAGSPAVGAARCLTRTINAGTGSTSLAVLNPRAIFGGWSEVDLPGDSLLIGSSETPVAVTAVNNDTKVVTISPAATWSVWDEVWLYRDGRKVNDIGARQQ